MTSWLPFAVDVPVAVLFVAVSVGASLPRAVGGVPPMGWDPWWDAGENPDPSLCFLEVVVLLGALPHLLQPLAYHDDTSKGLLPFPSYSYLPGNTCKLCCLHVHVSCETLNHFLW